MKEYIDLTTGEVITRKNKLQAFIYFYKESKKWKYRTSWAEVKELKGGLNHEA